MLTRKHFEAIAKAVRESDLGYTNAQAVGSKIAYTLREFNPNFDEERFVQACTEGLGTPLFGERK